MKVGILGAGNIAISMAKALHGIGKDVTAYAVASRELKKAEAFAKEYGIEKAYGSYEDLVSDPEVDLIYVATPHSHHFAHAKLCMEHGKAVLVEKAFTVNASQAEALIKLSEEKQVFLAEAMWTRYLPARHTIEELLANGIIGDVVELEAEFSIPLTHIPRLVKPELAGGALLDLGIYPLTFAVMYFGTDIVGRVSECVKYETGVDGTDEVTYNYRDGRKAHIRSSFISNTKNEGSIVGTKGSIFVETLNNYTKIQVHDLAGNLVQDYPVEPQINGYEYEVLACKKAMEEGKLACEEMSHSMTLHMMQMMDELRADWGVKYPFE